MRRPGFHTITLGCKLNQFDSAGIAGELLRRGFRPEPDRTRARVVLVNTCTVTHRADAEARKLIRSVRRRNPRCTLLVTGCYAERDAERLRAIHGVDRVFGNREKPQLATILDELGLGGLDPGQSGDRGCDAVAGGLHFGERSRAFLKVQEGCRLACSYCVIPQVRGPSRSVPAERVEVALSRLLDAGYREVVLTGVNTGDYGRDLDPPSDLAALLRRLLDRCGPNRIRLNSLEPLTIRDAIIELLAGDPRLAPHLQVPLQSGSESVLRRMRRNYGLDAYRRKLQRVRQVVPDAGLGADVIVGFPGETNEDFERTLRFVADSPLNYLHVFSWSPRPGTPAAAFGDRVPAAEIRERSSRLRELGRRLALDFRKRFVGRRLDGVVLDARGRKPRALTGNFIEVDLPPGSRVRAGDWIGIDVTQATADQTRGRPAPPPAWARVVDPRGAARGRRR